MLCMAKTQHYKKGYFWHRIVHWCGVSKLFVAKGLEVCIWRDWQQILIWSENHELHSFKDVLSEHGLLTLAQGSNSSAPLVYAKFLHIYIGEISGSNPDIIEIIGKTPINFNRAGVSLKKVSYLCEEILSSMARMQKIQENLKEMLRN